MAKLIKATGLVPVTFVRTAMPYRKGQTLGLIPAAAAAAVKAGDAVEFMDLSEGVEAEDIVLIGPPPPAPDEPRVPAPADSIEIPEDWETMHHLKRIALAKKFDPAVTNDDEARAAIAAELERRKE